MANPLFKRADFCVTLLKLGASFSGKTTVSKTVDRGSIPRAPAKILLAQDANCFASVRNRRAEHVRGNSRAREPSLNQSFATAKREAKKIPRAPAFH